MGHSQRLGDFWASLGPRFLPFADAASPELPLSRLLRLALFQVSVGMAVVLLVGTLNRVLIVELGVDTWMVSMMVALPVLWAPFRALIGFRSDHHDSALGWRRVPYLWMGTLLQFSGFALMPFALLVLAGQGDSARWPPILGPLGAGAAFLLVGAGLHTTQTAGLALATDLAPEQARPRVVGLMYVMLLLGSIVSAFVFGAFLREFSPGRLVQVLQAAALVTLVLNVSALWKQETRQPRHLRTRPPVAAPAFAESWRAQTAQRPARLRLLAIGLGTFAFGMQDVLLEPYGGSVLGMGVGTTTWLGAGWALGGLLGFAWASRVLARGFDAARMALYGACLGVPAFAGVIAAAPAQSVALLAAATLLMGFATGLFSHGMLTLTMNQAEPGQAGLALGTWGAVQATAAGVALGAGGALRDGFAALASTGILGTWASSIAAGYAAVYSLELALLGGAIVVLRLLGGHSPEARTRPHLGPSA